MTGLDIAPTQSRDEPEGPGTDHDGAGDTGDVLRSSPIRLLAVLASLVAVGVFLGLPILFIILALIVSIFLHELGHFLVARWSKMKVTEFFIGMGPRIWSFRRGETEYGLKVFPIGAYVRIIGMHNREEVPAEDEDRTYRSKSYPRRLATVVAGPAMNIAIGIVLFFIVFVSAGVPNPDDWTVGGVVGDGAAQAAGVQEGDRVVALAGESVGDWDQFTGLLDERAGETVELVVERDGEEMALATELGWSLSPEGVEALATDPELPMGSLVVAADGEAVASYEELEQVMASGSGPVELELDVADARYRVELERPLEMPDDGARGFLGVSLGEGGEDDSSVVGAATSSVTMVGDVGVTMGEFLGRLFSPSGLSRYADMVVGSTSNETAGEELAPLEPVGQSEPITAAGGPIDPDSDEAIRPLSIIGIVQVGGQLGDGGFTAILFLLAVVNVFLALINLIPLLPFDGGHAAVATYEAARGAVTRRRHRVDIAKLMPLTYAVVFLLLAVGLSAIWLDVTDPVQLVP